MGVPYQGADYHAALAKRGTRSTVAPTIKALRAAPIHHRTGTRAHGSPFPKAHQRDDGGSLSARGRGEVRAGLSPHCEDFWIAVLRCIHSHAEALGCSEYMGGDTPVEQDVRTRPFSEGSEVAGLSAVHGRLLLLVASMDPAPTNAIYSYLPRGYYGDVDEKNRRPRLSKWLNEMKAKGVIVPDPHNGISRKDFKWNITTKGRSMIR